MSGLIMQTQGQKEDAGKRFEQVLAIDPRAAVAANNLAWLQVEQGQNLDVALQLAQTAAASAPDSPEITDTLGWIYYKKNLPQQAIPQLERSVAKEPGNATYLHHLGLAYLQAGDPERGRDVLRRALAAKPDAQTMADIQRALSEIGPPPTN
jgi:tetratricopeptide (TPR) repeat protein